MRKENSPSPRKVSVKIRNTVRHIMVLRILLETRLQRREREYRLSKRTTSMEIANINHRLRKRGELSNSLVER